MTTTLGRSAPEHASYSYAGDFTISNEPNAAILMESLRKTGYGNRAALADIADNSIDAGASRIALVLQSDAESPYPTVVVADNGVGMGHDVLDEALKLGSKTEHDLRSDLGRFGLGLVTAGHSLARRVQVLTKAAGDPLYVSISDIDEMIRAEKFVKMLRPANAKELTDFKERMSELGFELPPTDDELHGTLILLERCDGWTGTKSSSAKYRIELRKSDTDVLADEFGATFREFIAAGRLEMIVNGKAVSAIDPFNLDGGGEIRLDQELEFDVIDHDGRPSTAKVRVKVGVLPNIDSGVPERQLPKLKNQGFSVLRNHREISYAQRFGIFTQHNKLNRMRGEIEFPAALDDLLNVHFSKQGVEPNQAFVDKLRELTKHTIRQIEKEGNRDLMKPGDEEAKMHREAEKDIAEKQHLLALPDGAAKERRDRGKPPRPHPPVSTPNSDPTLKRLRKRQPAAFKNVKFQEAALGASGPIYNADKENATIVITWNIEHPFYEVFVLGNNTRGAKVIDYLVYCLACAELMAHDDTTLDFIDNMRMITSTNMRMLLR